MPMIARKVVVLPAPLRPSSVTSSPSPMANSTPCKMCDSPYQACRLPTRNRSSGELREAGASAMSGPHIGLDDFGIAGHRLVVTLGENAAAGKDRDRVGQIGDGRQIVLHLQYRAVARGLPDQPGNAPDILMAETGHRLVEQHHLGV